MRKTQIFRYIRARSNVSLGLLRAWWPILQEVAERTGQKQQTVINHVVILCRAWANQPMAFQGLCHLYTGTQSGLTLVVLDELARYSERNPQDLNV